MFLRQCASNVLHSSLSVGCHKKVKTETDTDEIDIMEVPEKGNMRTTGSPPKKVMETLAQLECIYSNVQGIDNKQGEP